MAPMLRLSVCPVHKGVLAAGESVDGGGVFTTTFTVWLGPVQPFTVTFTEYVPAFANVALAMLGFCNEELKLFGPVHEYVAPAIVELLKLIALVIQTGLFTEAVGAAGIG